MVVKVGNKKFYVGSNNELITVDRGQVDTMIKAVRTLAAQ